MAILTSITVSPGDDLYRIAAQYYADAAGGAQLIMQANGLTDPLIQADMTIAIPTYSKSRANDGQPVIA